MMVRMTTTRERPTLNECITGMVQLLATRNRLTQTDLARALDVDKAVINRAYKGKRDWKASEVGQLAELFGVNRDVLLRDPDQLFQEVGVNMRHIDGYDVDGLLMEAA